MIADAGRVTVGLNEDDTGQVAVALAEARSALSLLRSRAKPELHGLLERVNVVVLSGPWGRWNRYDAQVWVGLGARVDPSLLTTFTANLNRDDCTVSMYDRVDPPIMLESWRLLPSYDGVKNSDTEQLRKASTKLRKLGILYHPHAASRRGLDYLLTRRSVRLDGLALVPVKR